MSELIDLIAGQDRHDVPASLWHPEQVLASVIESQM
jgi:hypothetical protein